VAGEYGALVLLAAVSVVGLPGPVDSALIAAGLLAAEGHLRLSAVIVLAFLACLAGRALGYWPGSAGGRPLMERPGPLQRFRSPHDRKGRPPVPTIPSGRPVIASAALSGIYRVTRPVFAVSSVLVAAWWTLATGLSAYFLGPAAADILSDIGVRGAIAVVIIAALGLPYRYLLQRRNPPHSEPEPQSGAPDIRHVEIAHANRASVGGSGQ
jgi:membrane protein DedA with SNARE-associated domain